MAKEDINLLPPAAIGTRATTIYLRRLGSLQRFGLVLLVGLMGILAAGWLALRYETGALAADHRESAALSQEFITTVTTINEQLAAVRAWRAEYVVWTPLLPEVLAKLPSGISLAEIQLDEKTKALTISGTFTSREALLAFQRGVEGLPWVAAVDAPLSNFATGEEARFSLVISREVQP